MVQSLKVILWGEEIGRLAWDVKRRLSYFMYREGRIDFRLRQRF